MFLTYCYLCIAQFKPNLHKRHTLKIVQLHYPTFLWGQNNKVKKLIELCYGGYISQLLTCEDVFGHITPSFGKHHKLDTDWGFPCSSFGKML